MLISDLEKALINGFSLGTQAVGAGQAAESRAVRLRISGDADKKRYRICVAYCVSGFVSYADRNIVASNPLMPFTCFSIGM